MIRYSLICDRGHEFESWFRDSASFDSQSKRGLVSCPGCESTKISKTIMAPRVSTSEAKEAARAPLAPAADAGEQFQLAAAPDAELRAKLRALRDYVKANAENVGDKFADTARKMHYGEVEHRSIYGQSTPEDAKALHDEGIEFHPLPLLPDDRN